MKPRILFVDDEPSMLRGLRRMLFEYSELWEMEFAGSGEEALSLFKEHSFDIIIADLKMPSMDGVELLTRVREEHPGTMRVILSGYSDKDRLIDSTRVAHQFLSKPSSPEVILGTVASLLALSDLSIEEPLRSIVTGLESLPVQPGIYDELYRIAGNPKASPEEIGELVMRDMGLTASVLKLVNTAFFGLPLHITDPVQAVTLLGLDNLRGMMARDDFITKFDTSRFAGFDQVTLWSHSLTTARYAQAIAEVEGLEKKECELIYTAGMLHDIGKLILSETHHGEYAKVIELSKGDNIAIIDAEQKALHTTHAEVGAYLLGLWGFADPIVQAAARHHTLEGSQGALPVISVHAANALEHELVVLNDHYAPHPVDEHHLEESGFSQRYGVWREACQKLDDNA